MIGASDHPNDERLRNLDLETPMLGHFRQKTETNNKRIFRIEVEDLNMFFERKNLKEPTNQGESRISLQILAMAKYIKGLSRMLDTSIYTGVVGDKEDIDRRRKFFGKHTVAVPRIESFWWVKLPRQFEEANTIHLIWAASFYLFFGFFTTGKQAFIECLMIFFGLSFAAAIQAVCEYLKDVKWLDLQAEIGNQQVKVFRGNGEARTIQVTDLVVGDVISIDAGNKVPVDCILFEEMNITVDESIYRGHPKASKHLSEVNEDGSDHPDNHTSNPDPFLLAESKILSGQGKALVCAIGQNTRLSRHCIQGDLDFSLLEGKQTSLEKKLKVISNYIEKSAFVMILAVVLTRGIFHFCMAAFGDASLFSIETLQSAARIGIAAIVLGIVIIPEGLSLVAQIATAISLGSLRDDKILVKNHEAIPNAATITDICVSKTGVLTEGKGTVTKYVLESEGEIFDNNSNTSSSFREHDFDSEAKQAVIDCILMNSDVTFEAEDDSGIYRPTGPSIEVSAIEMLYGVNP